MCNFLQIKLWPLPCGNHKVNSVEKYHRLLNKTQAIAGQNRGNYDIFVQTRRHISTRGTAPQ